MKLYSILLIIILIIFLIIYNKNYNNSYFEKSNLQNMTYLKNFNELDFKLRNCPKKIV